MGSSPNRLNFKQGKEDLCQKDFAAADTTSVNVVSFVCLFLNPD